MRDAVVDPVVLTYGVQDLGARPIFEGGFINFGYWKNISTAKGYITKQERVQASENLYDLITDQLELNHDDVVLEVGSGQGYGSVRTFQKAMPKEFFGIDLTLEQVIRARWAHRVLLQNHKNLHFENASADSTPFPDQYFTKIYSVEAMQCFPSLEQFALEAWRILARGGKMALTAHFSTCAEGYNKIKELIPTVEQGIDRLIPIQDVQNAFSRVGFKELSVRRIGEHVFEPVDTWITQVQCPVWWTHNPLKAYKKGFLDYYVLELEKD